MRNIVICGSLCNNDIALAELLWRYGLKPCVIRYDHDSVKDFSQFSGSVKFFPMNAIAYIHSSLDFLKIATQSKLIISISGAALHYISPWWRWVYKMPFMPKIINLTTGSDITELVREKTIAGKKYRSFLQNIHHAYISPYPEALKSLKILKNFRHYSMMRCPYYLMREPQNNAPSEEGPITFFHLSNLDWGFTDNKPHRNSTKGNDRFIKAFARCIKEGLNIRCVFLDRGPDKEAAKSLIKSLEISKNVEFIPPMTQGELQLFIKKSDIIVDQFDVGFAGGIAFESMAQAKSVMLYFDKNCWPLVYADEPPIINCRAEDEIYNAILEWSDKKKLQVLGEKAEKWVRKYHDVHRADFSEFILRVCLAAGINFPSLDSLKKSEPLEQHS